MAKKLIKEIRPYVKLYRDTNNGIAWIEDGSTGLGISVHPNLDKSGSVTGMKKLGYWDKSDRIVLSHGWKYNIDRFVCDAPLMRSLLFCTLLFENLLQKQRFLELLFISSIGRKGTFLLSSNS